MAQVACTTPLPVTFVSNCDTACKLWCAIKVTGIPHLDRLWGIALCRCQSPAVLATICNDGLLFLMDQIGRTRLCVSRRPCNHTARPTHAERLQYRLLHRALLVVRCVGALWVDAKFQVRVCAPPSPSRCWRARSVPSYLRISVTIKCPMARSSPCPGAYRIPHTACRVSKPTRRTRITAYRMPCMYPRQPDEHV